MGNWRFSKLKGKKTCNWCGAICTIVPMKKRVFGVPCGFVVKLEKLDNAKYPLKFSVFSRIGSGTKSEQYL